jgi:hypothetical protein
MRDRGPAVSTRTWVYLAPTTSVTAEPEVRLNDHNRADPFVTVDLGPIEITAHEPDHAEKIAAAFSRAAHMLREAQDGKS